MERLSLKKLSGVGLEGRGVLYWGPWKICKERLLALDTGIFLHMGPFTAEGNLESGKGLVYRGP
jgi:hypothetical protein